MGRHDRNLTRSAHKRSWVCGEKLIPLGEMTAIMGIVNTTPDSFSDGGQLPTLEAALEQALALSDAGATLIDIGGESSRPGASPVAVSEEYARTIPLIHALRAERPLLPISIDTTKAAIAQAAIEAGADIINDISGMSKDPHMIDVASSSGAGVVIMHMQGAPQTMQKNPTYDSVADDVLTYLKNRYMQLQEMGIAAHSIVIDPGIGFGKTTAHNLDLLRAVHTFEQLAPTLIGVSRKRFLGELTGRSDPKARTAGSLGAAAYALMQGASILRVHDVIETCDLCMVMDTLLGSEH
jgi:dihydropteroate synthase